MVNGKIKINTINERNRFLCLVPNPNKVQKWRSEHGGKDGHHDKYFNKVTVNYVPPPP